MKLRNDTKKMVLIILITITFIAAIFYWIYFGIWLNLIVPIYEMNQWVVTLNINLFFKVLVAIICGVSQVFHLKFIIQIILSAICLIPCTILISLYVRYYEN